MASVPESEAKLHATVVSGWRSESPSSSDKSAKTLHYNNPMWPGREYMPPCPPWSCRDDFYIDIIEVILESIAGQIDLEESLEASGYSSHPYSSHPKETPLRPSISEVVMILEGALSLDMPPITGASKMVARLGIGGEKCMGTGKKVLLLRHSKGGVDAAAALSIYWPDLKDEGCRSSTGPEPIWWQPHCF